MNRAPLTVIMLMRVFLPFALGYYLSYFYRTVNAVIAPDLIRDLDINANSLGLLTGTYFITFAAFQLPLGILLDRVGPRKTEAVLLIFAAAGALVFSFAESVGVLIIGRGLIGFGVSACLMASFKAFADWFPKEKLALTNGLVLAAGGVGAITATAPVETALQFTDWRGVFMVLAGASLVAAAVIYFVVPERPEAMKKASAPSIETEIRELGQIFKSPIFIRLIPFCVLSQSTSLSILTLWVGPWLRDVGGLERDEVANSLLFIAFALMAGFMTTGVIAERFSRIGIKTLTFSTGGMIFFAVFQIIIVFGDPSFALPIWMLFAFTSTTGAVAYAGLSQNFDSSLIGRVNTALNLMIFIGAFSFQWGIGAIINLWPAAADGRFAPDGYQTAFVALLILQGLAIVWLWASKFIWPDYKI